MREECCDPEEKYPGWMACDDCPIRGPNNRMTSALPKDDRDVSNEQKLEKEVRQAIETILAIRQKGNRLIGYTTVTAKDIYNCIKRLGVLILDSNEVPCGCVIGRCSNAEELPYKGVCISEAITNRIRQSEQPGPEQGSGAGEPEVSGRPSDGSERLVPGPIPAELPAGERSGQTGATFWHDRTGSRERRVDVTGPSVSPSLAYVQHVEAGRGRVHPSASPIGEEPPAQRSSDEGPHEGSPSVRSAAERLRDLAALREQRQKVYGDHFLNKGALLLALFPEGVVLKTEEDFARWANLSQTVDKLHRYCVNFTNGGHEDSLDDLSVYAQIQAYMDEVLK